METIFTQRVGATKELIKKASMCKHCLNTAIKTYETTNVCESHYKTFKGLDQMGSDY